MKQEKAYKIKLVKILEILRQDSDEDHYLESTEILTKLKAMGIECDRRTLYGDIDVLNDFGYEVLCEKTPGKANKYCVADRNFDVPELRILMDAVQASRFITPKKTDVLLDKIADLGGSHRAELLRSELVQFNTVKSNNESIFYSISEIGQAIENDKKVSFKYFTYGIDHGKVYRFDAKRNEDKRYFVNPVATVYDDENYYLIGYYGNFSNLVHFRIDRMDSVRMVAEQPKDPYKGNAMDLQHHKKTLFSMYQGGEQEVEFLAEDSILDPLFDKFGDKVQITKDGENNIRFKANVQLSPTFFGWCLSFGDKLKITAPQDVVEQIKEYIQKISSGY